MQVRKDGAIIDGFHTDAGESLEVLLIDAMERGDEAHQLSKLLIWVWNRHTGLSA